MPEGRTLVTIDGQPFIVVVERDEDGWFVGEVPGLSGCYSQGRTLPELIINMREVIALSLEDSDDGPLLKRMAA